MIQLKNKKSPGECHEREDQGFKYAVSGSVSPAERRVVEKVADVIAVEDSEGAYGDLLRK